MDRCRCHHGKSAHNDETGRCQSGDDDGDGYFDQCWCEAYDELPPTPPGIVVDVGAGVHTRVVIDGRVFILPTPVVMSCAGQIFIPLEVIPND